MGKCPADRPVRPSGPSRTERPRHGPPQPPPRGMLRMPHRASHGHAPILRPGAVRRTGSRAARGLWYSASLPGKAGPFSRGGPVPLRNPRPVPRRPDGTGRPPFPYAASAMDSLPFQPPCPTAGIHQGQGRDSFFRQPPMPHVGHTARTTKKAQGGCPWASSCRCGCGGRI